MFVRREQAWTRGAQTLEVCHSLLALTKVESDILATRRHGSLQTGDESKENRGYISSLDIIMLVEDVVHSHRYTSYILLHAGEAQQGMHAPFQLHLTSVCSFTVVRGFPNCNICIVICCIPCKDQHASIVLIFLLSSGSACNSKMLLMQPESRRSGHIYGPTHTTPSSSLFPKER
jgi:hypothetical protein